MELFTQLQQFIITATPEAHIPGAGESLDFLKNVGTWGLITGIATFLGLLIGIIGLWRKANQIIKNQTQIQKQLQAQAQIQAQNVTYEGGKDFIRGYKCFEEVHIYYDPKTMTPRGFICNGFFLKKEECSSEKRKFDLCNIHDQIQKVLNG